MEQIQYLWSSVRSGECLSQLSIVQPIITVQKPCYYHQKEPSVFPGRACSRWEDTVQQRWSTDWEDIIRWSDNHSKGLSALDLSLSRSFLVIHIGLESLHLELALHSTYVCLVLYAAIHTGWFASLINSQVFLSEINCNWFCQRAPNRQLGLCVRSSYLSLFEAPASSDSLCGFCRSRSWELELKHVCLHS